MNKIHALSPEMVSKIAAGEVIERPSYAVKELIENAIDAGATEIKVYLEDAGLKKILVVDNGEGMTEDDVKESWKPHTTSKIHDEYELHSIKSLGFRGEALSSLAAVSTLTVQSRKLDTPTGFSVTIQNGKLTHSTPVGMPIGTSILVEQLFSSLPGRKKFLKSISAELRQSVDVVNRFALAYSHIRFVLSHGKKTLIDYPQTASSADRIDSVVTSDTSSFFIPITKNESYIKLHGFVAKPQLNATTQHKQYLFVNARDVTDKRIAMAVKEAYGTMLESTAYPLFVLFITLPYEMVDVNVHPRKEQVQFVDNKFVSQTVKQMVRELLEEHNLTFENLSWKRAGVGLANSYAGKVLKKTVLDAESFSGDQKVTFLQFFKQYIVVCSKTDLFLVDQHAAHERILFEKLKMEFIKQKGSNISYRLPTPVTLTLTAASHLVLEAYVDLLTNMGFKFQKASITHVPLLFQDRDPLELMTQLLDDLSINDSMKSIDNASEEMLAFLACRAAVKAGDVLTNEQMKTILIDLGITPNSATCPHGRPTRIAMSIDQLNTMFKRT